MREKKSSRQLEWCRRTKDLYKTS